MNLYINWNEPIIREKEVLRIQPGDLDDFYCSASDLDKTNIFFVLLASFHHYEEKEDLKKAAYLSYLMAYYLFITLTPPASLELAKHYIRQAISLDPLDIYKEWEILIEKGN